MGLDTGGNLLEALVGCSCCSISALGMASLHLSEGCCRTLASAGHTASKFINCCGALADGILPKGA